MKGSVVAALLATVVVGAVVAVAVSRDSSQTSEQRTFRDPFMQRLNPHDREIARRVVDRDRELKRIAGKHTYRVTSIGIWERGAVRRNPELLKILTQVEVMIDPPIKFLRIKWPYLSPRRKYPTRDRGGANPPYRRWRLLLPARDLSEVSVFVDLRRAAVAAIVPGYAAQLGD
jgi:hypothetical protein